MKYVYATLCVAGAALPYGAFAPWLLEHGLNVPLLISAALVNDISVFAWLDVVVSAIVLLVFIFAESRRLGLKLWWLPVLATFTVGVSLGLPLFLFLRELHIEKQTAR